MSNVTTANVQPGIEAAQATNRGPGTNEHNAPAIDTRVMNTSVSSFLNPADNRPQVRGLVLRRKKNKETGALDGDITGVVLMKKKDFIKMVKDAAQKPAEQGGFGYREPMSNKDAEARFEKYRVATYSQFTQETAQRLLKGELALDGARVKGDEIVSLSVVRKNAQARDNKRVFIEKAALANGIPAQEMQAFIEKYRAAHPVTDVSAQPAATDVAAIETPATEVPAKNEGAAQPAGTNVPQHVAAGS